MKDYMAPMEGVTNFVYRRTYHRFYHPMDKYFTPFISAKPKKNPELPGKFARCHRSGMRECTWFPRS